MCRRLVSGRLRKDFGVAIFGGTLSLRFKALLADQTIKNEIARKLPLVAPHNSPHPGSSPLSRGAPLPTRAADWSPGIIPALAGSTLQCQHGDPRGGDHPRSRGEHPLALVTGVHPLGSSPLSRGAQIRDFESVGSSPLSRGALLAATARLGLRGIIPALAGSTVLGVGRRPTGRDHPRSRGEHGALGTVGTVILGSSPLSRGARWRRPARIHARGIIPALAGSTKFFTRQGNVVGDHPRSRGEHRGVPSSLRLYGGSSPLSRGARLTRLLVDREIGIIPALAGSTSRRTSWLSVCGDHPRSRGEHVEAELGDDGVEGSSPLSRGAPVLPDSRRADPGIIPALAGSTPRRGIGGLRWWDHPRSRGEHRRAQIETRVNEGSSPLSRGAPPSSPSRSSGPGIIPALAGSTWSNFLLGGWVGDHPRSRGEHTLSRVALTVPGGSSPLSRGAPWARPQRRGRRGIIPALAGST